MKKYYRFYRSGITCRIIPPNLLAHTELKSYICIAKQSVNKL